MPRIPNAVANASIALALLWGLVEFLALLPARLARR